MVMDYSTTVFHAYRESRTSMRRRKIMTQTSKLRVVVIKPSKYNPRGLVDRFWKGFMTNSTIYYIASLIPSEVAGVPVEVHTIDEYVEPNLHYLELLRKPDDRNLQNLVALVGVQKIGRAS